MVIVLWKMTKLLISTSLFFFCYQNYFDSVHLPNPSLRIKDDRMLTQQANTLFPPPSHESWFRWHSWRRQCQPTPVLLPGKSHGRRTLVGCSPWGHEESDTTERLHFHALEKEMLTHSSVLAWRIPGTVEPGGLQSMGSHRVAHNWSNLAAAAAAIYASNVARHFYYIKVWVTWLEGF